MPASAIKKVSVKSKPSNGKKLSSARRIGAQARQRALAGSGAVMSGAGASPRAASRNASNEAISYSPQKGVSDFAKQVAEATPLEAVDMERKGVSSRYLKDLAKHLGLATTRVFGIIDVPRATAAKKVAKGESVTGHSGQAALALTKLVALANEIAVESTDPRAPNFDASKWLGTWIERPQPALGGRKPADLLDTPTGADVVTRLLGSVASGAYQ